MDSEKITNLLVIIGLLVVLVVLKYPPQLPNNVAIDLAINQPRVVNALSTQEAYVYEIVRETEQYEFSFAFEKMREGDIVTVCPKVFGGQIIPVAVKDSAGSARVTGSKPWGGRLFVYSVAEDGVTRLYISDEILLPGEEVSTPEISISCGSEARAKGLPLMWVESR